MNSEPKSDQVDAAKNASSDVLGNAHDARPAFTPGPYDRREREGENGVEYYVAICAVSTWRASVRRIHHAMRTFFWSWRTLNHPSPPKAATPWRSPVEFFACLTRNALDWFFSSLKWNAGLKRDRGGIGRVGLYKSLSRLRD